MLRKLSVTCLAVLVIVSFSHAAHAALAAVGPVSPQNGFPLWYQDTNGLALELCLDGDGALGPCLFDPVDPANPYSVQIGFGDEAFY